MLDCVSSVSSLCKERSTSDKTSPVSWNLVQQVVTLSILTERACMLFLPHHPDLPLSPVSPSSPLAFWVMLFLTFFIEQSKCHSLLPQFSAPLFAFHFPLFSPSRSDTVSLPHPCLPLIFASLQYIFNLFISFFYPSHFSPSLSLWLVSVDPVMCQTIWKTTWNRFKVGKDLGFKRLQPSLCRHFTP